MSEDNSKVVQLPSTTTVVVGICQRCNENLTDILSRFLRGEIDLPRHCPGCGRQITGVPTIEVYTCSACGGELVRKTDETPGEAHCIHCGIKLDYSTLGHEPKKVEKLEP